MTEFINYAVVAHGDRVKNDYITLPSGIRVVMICTSNSCWSSLRDDMELYSIILNGFDPKLNDFENVWYDRKNNPTFNFCVYSGNIDDEFKNKMPKCRRYSLNRVPNIQFYRTEYQRRKKDLDIDPKIQKDNEGFVAGIYKIPSKMKFHVNGNPKSTEKYNSDFVLRNYNKAVKKVRLRNPDLTKDIAPEDMEQHSVLWTIVRPNNRENREKEIFYDSDYIAFNRIRYPYYPQAEDLEINNLASLIEYLKVKEGFDKRKCMITIFIHACAGEEDEGEDEREINEPEDEEIVLFSGLCMISLQTYRDLKLNFEIDGTRYNNVSAGEYDIMMANSKKSTRNFREFIDQRYFTYKHQLSGLTDEAQPSYTNNVRMFRDISTSAFVNNILNDNTTRFLFLDYTFHMINGYIGSEINDYLIIKDQLPLYGDESVIFVFKGGNVLNYYMDKNINLAKNIFNRVSTQTVNDIYPQRIAKNIVTENQTYSGFIDDIVSNFKISDVDYSVYINASNYARFVLINEGVTQIIGKALSKISDNFDNLYTHIDNVECNDADIANSDESNMYSDQMYTSVKANYDALKNILKNEYYNQIRTSVTDKSMFTDEYNDVYGVKDIFLRANDHMATLNNTTSDMHQHRNIYHLIMYIQYCYTILHININGNTNVPKNDTFTNIKRLRSWLRKLLQKKFYNICRINFYTNQKIADIKNSIYTELNNLRDVPKYELLNNGLQIDSNTYVLKKDVEINDIEFPVRSNMLIISNNDPTRQTANFSSTDKHHHYITFNNIIKVVRNANITNFNLMRIKFSAYVKAGKVYKNDDDKFKLPIPSEFIDVSVPLYDDFNRPQFIKSTTKGITTISLNNSSINREIIVQSYGMDDLVEDLINVLFEQNYIPWLDPKYNKRLIRFLYIGILNAQINDNLNDNLENELTVYEDMLNLANTMLNFISDGGNFPYNECTKFIATLSNRDDINQNDEYIRPLIDDIAIRYKNTHFTDLLNINDKYKHISKVINFIIVYSKFLDFDDESVKIAFLNKNRYDYGFVEITQDNFAEVVELNTIKFKEFLVNMVTYGFKLLFMHKILFYLRVFASLPNFMSTDITQLLNNPNSANTPQVNQLFEQTNSFRRYILELLLEWQRKQQQPIQSGGTKNIYQYKRFSRNKMY